jgi:hypothetical protein
VWEIIKEKLSLILSLNIIIIIIVPKSFLVTLPEPELRCDVQCVLGGPAVRKLDVASQA